MTDQHDTPHPTEAAAPANGNLPVIWKLRRARRFWRVLFILALAVAAVTAWGRFAAPMATGNDYVARVVIAGVITTNPDRVRLFEELAKDTAVKAVLVAINSPGGTTAGGEELFTELGKLRAKKPVVATIDETGTSAAYMTAIATDRIFARNLSIVGSIGVLMQHVNAKKLLDTIGLEFDKVQTGPLKAEPDVNDPLTGPVREHLQALVDDSFNWFVDVVAERRALPRPTVLALADGRILTGRQALAAKLIDETGGEAEARAWLATTRTIALELPTITVEPQSPSLWSGPLRWLGGEARAALGLGESISGDALVSVWSPTN
jgi:protease-4